jgi:23S rRNA pseudouridine2457 synthase
VLSEGKNRQIRKMTAAVGHPTLRLVRYGIEKTTLEGMAPGEVQEIEGDTFRKLISL